MVAIWPCSLLCFAPVGGPTVAVKLCLSLFRDIQRYSEGTALFIIFSHVFQGFLREFLPWSGSSCRHVRRSTSCLGL